MSEINDLLHNKINKLKGILHDKKVIVAFSGGSDSLILSQLAKKYAKDLVLAIVTGPNIPIDEIDRAKDFAKVIDSPLYILEYDPLSSSSFYNNTPLRCYACKRLMFKKLNELKMDLKYDMIVDGTNKSDMNEDRPGLKALEEFGIISPFALSGISKKEVLLIGEELGLSSWLVPSNTCYATRIMDGLKITEELLNIIRQAELKIREICGVKLVRARIHTNLHCRIEVYPEEIHKLIQQDVRELLIKELSRIGLKYISVDLKGYRK